MAFPINLMKWTTPTEDSVSIEIMHAKDKLGAEVNFDPDAMIRRLQNQPETAANPRIIFPPKTFFPQTAAATEPAA